ncbi:PAS domain S-box protein [Denitromonas ohlonensis]|uniref:histidine kinase n=2 Tax=Denitromonas TaxID=139331 RepID=A0A557SPK6_9RHOO|nr:PAS domain S-box protein [Denitromonas ohlonensis]TVO65758.1 PAS domain S-box protein [Denitromonas ohlonensis]TVO79351.1 PAS domain S-box protein [Denitromonas ohlonensis]TVT49964.1 MAG: PAS domain S-box protein [Denitromonas halophila]TVT67487.1 MAG: PAS domain S-box protein [Denitromonas halophila]
MDSHDKPADLHATPSSAKRLLHRSLALAGLALVVLLVLSGKWWAARNNQAVAATDNAGSLPALNDATGWIGLALLVVVLGVALSLGFRSIRNYRFAVDFAHRATAVTEFNQRRLMDFVELSSDWLWETDIEHRFTLMSEGMRSMANMDSAEFVGAHLWELPCNNMDAGRWSDHQQRLAKHEPFTLLISRYDLSGALRHLEFVGKPLFRHGHFEGYRGVGRDLTQRINAERELRDSEERFRTLVEGSFDWFWEQDTQFRFTRLVTSPRNEHDLDIDAVIGKTRWALAEATGTEPHWKAHILRCEHHESFSDFVYSRRMSDGSSSWFSVSGRPYYDDAGRFCGYRGVARDITAERNIQLALAASEARYRTTFEHAPVGIITLDADGRRQSVNAAFAHMLGYPRRALLGRDFRTFTHPDDQAADDQAYRAFVSGQISSHQGEKRYVHQDGHTVWAHISVTALRDEHRGLKGFITIVEDITARIVAQRERRAAESRYRRLVDVTPDGIIVHRDDRILFANAAATHVFGAPNTTALLNTPLSRFFERPHTEDARRTLALNRHFHAGQTLPRAQFRFQGLSGTDVEVESTGVVVDFEGGPATLRVIRDISDRVLAERALQESRTRYQEVVESVNEVIFQTDLNGVFTFLNPAWTQISGHPIDSSVGQPLASFLHPDDRGRARVLFKRLNAGAAHDEIMELRIRTTEGEIRWLEAHARQMIRSAGGTIGIMGSLDDITTRKVAELTLKNVNMELEARVRARTAELEASNRELEAFSYSVSHDLRAPLRAIEGFASILQEDMAERLDATSGAYLARIRAATLRMAHLIDDLIELARLTRQTLRRENIDLSQLVEEITTEMRHESPERVVDIDITPGLTAHADRALMRVVLENLLRNAWKFSAGQAVTQIAFFATRDEDEVMFCVADNGVGFDMAYADKLFQPFNRLHVTSEYAGSGIGLATVARIIQRHGGQIRAESAPGEGARFSFSIGH